MNNGNSIAIPGSFVALIGKGTFYGGSIAAQVHLKSGFRGGEGVKNALNRYAAAIIATLRIDCEAHLSQLTGTRRSGQAYCSP